MGDELAELMRIRKAIEALALHLGAGRKSGAQGGGGAATGGPPQVAPDSDLDGKYGDPKVILNPRNWTGEPYKGSLMSECPSDFLEQLALVLDEFAAGESDDKKARYKRVDAARARGWARRARKREEPPAPAPDDDFGG